jgi:hypothetical protein
VCNTDSVEVGQQEHCGGGNAGADSTLTSRNGLSTLCEQNQCLGKVTPVGQNMCYSVLLEYALADQVCCCGVSRVSWLSHRTF